MPQFMKLKGVAKVHGLSNYDLRMAMEKLFAKNQMGTFPAGYFKVSLAYKVGKRWKLKKYKVEVYNKFHCECCGPYYVAEFVK